MCGIKINRRYLSQGVRGNSSLGFRTASLQHVGASGSSGSFLLDNSFNKHILRHLKASYRCCRHNDKRKTTQTCSPGALSLL